MRPLIIALILVCATAAAQESMPATDIKPQPQDAAIPHASLTGDEAAKQAITGGWRLLKSGNAAAAIKLFNTAARLDPKDANAYWGMGAATAQQRKFGVAVQLFERAGALEPNNARLAADAGLAYTRAATDSMSDLAERAKNLQKALAWFDKAEKLDPAYALTYANRAIALSYLGDYDKAWEDVSRAEGMDRNSLDPKLIAYLSEKRPRPEQAQPEKDIKLAQVEPPKPPTASAKIPESNVSPPIQPAESPKASVTPLSAAESKPLAKPTAQPAKQPKTGKPGESKAEPAPKETLRLTGGQAAGRKDRDVRHCLDLPTNEAIIRCVYPRR